MHQARTQTGETIDARDYNPARHGRDLCCADPACGAAMRYRKEALSHGSLTLKSAHFFSRDAGSHRDGCTAHEMADSSAGAETLDAALAAGKKILINLNIHLGDSFNRASTRDLRKPSTTEINDYAALAAASAQDVVKTLSRIRDKGGDDALARTYVNYQGRTMQADDFVIDNRDKYRRLLNRLYKTMENGPEPQQSITGFPRLIAFKPTVSSKRNGGLRGTPTVIVKNGGRQRIVLLQKADAAGDMRRTLQNDAYIIARPQLNRAAAQGALQQLAAGAQTVFLDMHWQVSHAQQVQSIAHAAQPRPETPAAR